jgi:MerR family transcriptional regulator/heat shock protein HspR
MNDPGCEPVFIISVAARLLEMHPQTLRKYEREGLIAPSRTTGNLRLYSDEDLDRLRQVKYLVNERGLNLAGVQMILELTRHMQALQEQLATTATTEGNPSLERASHDLTTLLRVLGSNSRRSGDQARSSRSSS